ncbi:MAG: Crp/Fnr family transcriptional regulator [Pelistega sp.]|nr:Crp/Fnr family transcriptional regulator [Pelistega sp.]
MSIFTNYDTKWFTVLNPEQKERVLQTIVISHEPAGTMIEQKGVMASAWMGVLEGLVKVSVGNSDGRITSLTGIPSGGWFGEGSLVKKEIRRYDVFALRDTKFARLPASTFDWLLDNSIPFNRFLLEQLNARVGQFIGRAESDRLLNADQRVAACLAELFNQELYHNTSLSLTITQEEVGYLAKLSRQRTNIALKRLENEAIIQVEYGTIHVLDLNRLKSFYLND